MIESQVIKIKCITLENKKYWINSVKKLKGRTSNVVIKTSTLPVKTTSFSLQTTHHLPLYTTYYLILITYYLLLGNTILKVVPSPHLLSTSIIPLNFSIDVFVIYNPNPVPTEFSFTL